MSLPQLGAGHVVRAWRLGPAVCVLVGGCRNVRAAEYSHVLFASLPPDPKVRAAVVAEVNPLASFGPSKELKDLVASSGSSSDLNLGGSGSHFLVVFDHKGHRNAEASDAWADPMAFSKRALEVMGETLGIAAKPEELDPVRVTLSLGGTWEPPTLVLGESRPPARDLPAPPPPRAARAPEPAAAPAPSTDTPQRLIHSVATLMAIDGKISALERGFLRKLGQRLQVNPAEVEAITEEVAAGRKAIQLPSSVDARWRLLDELVAAAAADYEIHPAELKVLSAVAGKLGLSAAQLHDRVTATLDRLRPKGR